MKELTRKSFMGTLASLVVVWICGRSSEKIAPREIVLGEANTVTGLFMQYVSDEAEIVVGEAFSKQLCIDELLKHLPLKIMMPCGNILLMEQHGAASRHSTEDNALPLRQSKPLDSSLECVRRRILKLFTKGKV